LIALLILVSALHAIRPLVPRGEPLIAAGFGLVHGLAFAALLGGLGSPARRQLGRAFPCSSGVLLPPRKPHGTDCGEAHPMGNSSGPIPAPRRHGRRALPAAFVVMATAAAISVALASSAARDDDDLFGALAPGAEHEHE
jgi:hypothetical protein